MSSQLLRAAFVLSAVAISSQATAAPDFAACFSLKPGVSFGAERTTVSIEKAKFMGQDAIAVTQSEGGVSSASFYDASGRKLLGNVRYGISAMGGDAKAPLMTESYSKAPEFPGKAAPGAKLKLSGSGKLENHADETSTPLEYEGFSDYTFVGFEDLATKIDYKDRTFSNTCHLSAEFEGGRMEAWYAPGFGRVKFERYSGDSLLMAEEIDSVIQE